MSICDKCMHDEVCGLEDNHEESTVFCSDMIPKDVFDKIRSEIEQTVKHEMKEDKKWALGLRYALRIIDKYRAESEDEE